MKYLLLPRNVGVLGALGKDSLFAFDFDGTLAPIVSARDDAAMRPSTLESFRALTELVPCAVISGRARDDVAARLGNARVKYVVGNHGMETGAEGEGADLTEIRDALVLELASHPGIDIEDKGMTLAVHYRRAVQPEKARAAIVRALKAWPVRVGAGKLVVNVTPQHAAHKGDALRALMAREGATRALFVGDDVTDEDAFRVLTTGGSIGVRIGPSRSAAPYYLKAQDEIDALLAALHRALSSRGSKEA